MDITSQVAQLGYLVISAIVAIILYVGRFNYKKKYPMRTCDCGNADNATVHVSDNGKLQCAECKK